MTTPVMIGNCGGNTPGIALYTQQLDQNGAPAGEPTFLQELTMGSFAPGYGTVVYQGQQLVIREMPYAVPQPEATETAAVDNSANDPAAAPAAAG